MHNIYKYEDNRQVCNMFLSKKSKEKPVCGNVEQGLDSPSSVYNDGALSVDLTMAVPGSSAQKHQYPSELHPLSSPPSRIVTSSGSGVEEAEVAQATASCSQTGCMRNFDMNRLPSGTDHEDQDGGGGGGAASSAVSIVSPIFLSGVVIGTANDCKTDTASAQGGAEASKAIHEEEVCNNNNNNNNNNNYYSALQNTGDHQEDEGDGDGHGVPRKKLRLSKEQSALLEESFREHHTLNPKQKNALAKQLNLRSRQVEVWFQNRRARTKLKQTEVDCEFLKRCCETLTEENRRLQREVEELRAIKVAPPCVIAQDFYMPLPAATLTICPSCERVGSTIDKRALTFAKPSYYLTNFTPPSAACS